MSTLKQKLNKLSDEQLKTIGGLDKRKKKAGLMKDLDVMGKSIMRDYAKNRVIDLAKELVERNAAEEESRPESTRKTETKKQETKSVVQPRKTETVKEIPKETVQRMNPQGMAKKLVTVENTVTGKRTLMRGDFAYSLVRGSKSKYRIVK